jgi:hypothetical protein
VFLPEGKSLSWQDLQEESRSRELAVYSDPADDTARDDSSVPARVIEYQQKREGPTYSVVHDRVQYLSDIKVNVIAVASKAGFAPWDRAGKYTEIACCRSGVSSDASDGEYFADIAERV